MKILDFINLDLSGGELILSRYKTSRFILQQFTAISPTFFFPKEFSDNLI